MKVPGMIAIGGSGIVVAGLCLLAVAPLWLPTTPVSAPATTMATADASPSVSVEAPTNAETAQGDEASDPPDYISLGNGTSIPAGTPEGCLEPAYIWIGATDGGPTRTEMLGADLVDMGAREFATGAVSTDEQGRPATYTVAPGDVLDNIGNRFCIYNGIALGSLNGYRSGEIQPGDVLTLNANLLTDWVSPFDD